MAAKEEGPSRNSKTAGHHIETALPHGYSYGPPGSYVYLIEFQNKPEFLRQASRDFPLTTMLVSAQHFQHWVAWCLAMSTSSSCIYQVIN